MLYIYILFMMLAILLLPKWIDLMFALQFAVLSATGGIQVEEKKMKNGTCENWKLVWIFPAFISFNPVISYL